MSKSLTVIPYREKEILEDLKMLVDQQEDPNSELHVNIHGFVEWEEDVFKKRVDEILQDASGNVILDNLSFQTLSEISSPLIETFLRELDKQELDPEKRRHCEKVFFESVLVVEG